MASTPAPVPLEPKPEKATIDAAAPETVSPASPDYAGMYSAVEDGGHALPAIPFAKVDGRFLRQIVDDPTGEKPGMIVVNTTDKHLYWVLEGGKAMRYGVGLGRQGYSWKGRAIVQWKRKWPTWTPPSAMIRRDPKLEKWRQGMQPGISNPLGSRALYIFKDGVYALPDPWIAGLEIDRQIRVIRLRAHVQSGRHGPLRSGSRQDAAAGHLD